ncbi:hypothetical protein ACFC6L_28990 [Kitasatospora phosalacinea]
MPFEEAHEAFRYFEGAQPFGEVVIGATADWPRPARRRGPHKGGARRRTC